MRDRVRTAALLAALCAWAPSAARGDDPVRWPRGDGVRADGVDPIQAARWSAMGAWITAQPAGVQPALTSIDAHLAREPRSAPWLADRAVVLRVLSRFDEAQAALDQSLALDRGVLADADVAMTRAYLLARGGHYADAVTAARTALTEAGGGADARTDLVIEVARWSMARGPDGLPDALVLLRELSAAGPPSPMLRATLCLALARAGRTDEAREVALIPWLPQSFATATASRRGSLTPAEGDAAAGVALVLAGRAREALEPLTRAAAHPLAPFRAQLDDALGQARRASLAPRRPTEP